MSDDESEGEMILGDKHTILEVGGGRVCMVRLIRDEDFVLPCVYSFWKRI